MIVELTKAYIGKRVTAILIDYAIIWIFTFFCIYELGEPNDRGGYTLSGWPLMVPALFWFIFIVITERYLGETRVTCCVG